MKDDKKTPDVSKLAAQLRDIWDEAFSGKRGPEHDAAFSKMGLAACFGAAAYDEAAGEDHAAVAMMQSFLRALADPTDPKLDYLRACNQPGYVENA